MKISGRTWKFGDSITTDHICPGRYFHLRTNLPELAKHTLEDARADYAPNVKKGDIIVAGRNFGMGSSREHAPVVIKLSGASAVLAKSFARIFYRNSINIGLPVIICDTDKIEEGNTITIDFATGKIVNETNGLEISFPPIPPVMMKILSEGGLVDYIRKHDGLKI
ncbi:MAG TPA: 3-isopropylmalate dehydratase small subunit [Nitrososphaerales archaeon]